MVITFCKKSWNCWRELNASAVPSTSTNVSAVVINRTREVGGEAEAGIMTVFHVLGLLVYLCVSHWELDLHSWSHACGQPFSPLPPSHLRVFSAPPVSPRGKGGLICPEFWRVPSPQHSTHRSLSDSMEHGHS